MCFYISCQKTYEFIGFLKCCLIYSVNRRTPHGAVWVIWFLSIRSLTLHMFWCTNHVLSLLKLSLGDFRGPGPLLPMRPRAVRYYCPDRQRWIRGNPETGAEEPELSDQWLCQTPRLLFLTLEQHGPGWSMAHFLEDEPPKGVGLMVDFEGDSFHRSATDFNWARDH